MFQLERLHSVELRAKPEYVRNWRQGVVGYLWCYAGMLLESSTKPTDRQTSQISP